MSKTSVRKQRTAIDTVRRLHKLSRIAHLMRRRHIAGKNCPMLYNHQFMHLSSSSSFSSFSWCHCPRPAPQAQMPDPQRHRLHQPARQPEHSQCYHRRCHPYQICECVHQLSSRLLVAVQRLGAACVMPRVVGGTGTHGSGFLLTFNICMASLTACLTAAVFVASSA